MPTAPKILAFAGSLRRASFNKKLAAVAASAVRAAGGEVTEIDLADHRMPIYDGDHESEHGIPEAALKLKAVCAEHAGYLIACPEYNSGMTAVLKNTIDWLSRRGEGEKPLAPFERKVCALVAASPGELGGRRGLVHVRMVLSNLKVMVIPEFVVVPRAATAFDESGRLIDESTQGRVEVVAARLVEVAARLAG